MQYIAITPIALALVIAISYLINIIRLKKVYKKYLNIEWFISGGEIARELTAQQGYNFSFAIYRPKKPTLKNLNPFYGNAYIPDEDLFVMKREIMDGRTLLSFCIGCQLATSAVEYREGRINFTNQGEFMGEYALKYKYDKREIETVQNSYFPVNNSGNQNNVD